MIKKINILILLLFILNNGFANEKFLKIKGKVIDEVSLTEISNYTIKIVLDDLDSSKTNFESTKYDVWLPANRKAKVFYMKPGYTTKFLLVDASFIPSFAYKKKQVIDLNIKLTKAKRQTTLKPFCTANFKSTEAKFILTYNTNKPKVNKNFKAPFPLPINTYKGARPTDINLKTVANINRSHLNETSPYFKLVQGVLFAHINYCVFNEHIQKSNLYLSQLVEIDKNNWSNVKPFDSPEYASIVLKTLNVEKSRDTLFALGSWIGTSELLFKDFTTNSKIILHGKKLVKALKVYKGVYLNQSQKNIVIKLNEIADLYDKLIENYMVSMKNRTPIDLKKDSVFIEIKEKNKLLYRTLVN